MSHVPMIFQFQDRKSAALAYDTLKEIGYHVHRAEQADQAVVQVFVDHSELTSALEIAQAHGGDLIAAEAGTGENQEFGSTSENDRQQVVTGGQLFNTAYGMDMVPIPAHLVNEDSIADEMSSAEAPDFDPSGDDYDGFPAGVHL